MLRRVTTARKGLKCVSFDTVTAACVVFPCQYRFASDDQKGTEKETTGKRNAYGPNGEPIPPDAEKEPFTPLTGLRQATFVSLNPAAGSSPQSNFSEKPKGSFSAEDFKNFKKPAPGSGAAEERHVDKDARKNYVRSTEYFAKKTVSLKSSYAGKNDAQDITPWERFWWNNIRWFWTFEVLAGKDRHGNVFTRRWHFPRGRSEIRKVYRLDKAKRFQPYGALPTDSRQWESWMRGWRQEPPTPEEERNSRRLGSRNVGPHAIGEEEIEDTIVRSAAHSSHSGASLQELDRDENYNRFFTYFDDIRKKENDPKKEASTWTTGFARGDYFYNEEEVETMRTNMANLFRDREWQALEMKRQQRMRRVGKPVNMPDRDHPDFYDPNFFQGEPRQFDEDRIDGHVPCMDGVEQLTTPELQRLHIECDSLEEERHNLRKELGLTDIGDFRDGRAPIVQDKDPYATNPLSKRWKPKVWDEAWGFGGGHSYNR